MSVPRADFAAVALANGTVLLIGGQTSATTDTATVDRFISQGTAIKVEPAAPMAVARSGHTAMLAGNGKVLVAGGDGGSAARPTGYELYDPVTNTWTSVTPTWGDRATGPAGLRLNDGRIVVAGGLTQVVPGAGTEIYDPAMGQVTMGRYMPTSQRSYATAVQLVDGSVMVIGGMSTYTMGGALNTTDLYSLTDGAESAGPAMNVGHAHATTTQLSGGRILVAGGQAGASDSIAIAEIYDPTSKTWSLVNSMLTARGNHVAVLMSGNRVLVAGGVGQGGAITASTEIYTAA